MKTNIAIITLLTAFWGAILMSQTVFAKMETQDWIKRTNTTVTQDTLEPGWRMSCHTNFVIENLGDDEAKINIALGIEGFTKDQVSVSQKRGYDLRESLAFAKQLGKSVTMDDVALITNQSDSARIRVHC